MAGRRMAGQSMEILLRRNNHGHHKHCLISCRKLVRASLCKQASVIPRLRPRVAGVVHVIKRAVVNPAKTSYTKASYTKTGHTKIGHTKIGAQTCPHITAQAPTAM